MLSGSYAQREDYSISCLLRWLGDLSAASFITNAPDLLFCAVMIDLLCGCSSDAVWLRDDDRMSSPLPSRMPSRALRND
jgi:hypothetical protein